MTLITAFANLFGLGGAPLCAMARGKATGKATRHHGQLRDAAAKRCRADRARHRVSSPAALPVRRQWVTYPYASSYIVIYLIGTLCVMLSLGLNPRHQLSGLCPNRHAHRGTRRGSQHRARPDFHFRTAPRRARRCYRDRAVAVSVCCMGRQVFNRQKAELKLDFRGFRPDRQCIQRITVLGIASFVMSFTDTLVQVAFNATLRNFRRRPLHQRHDCRSLRAPDRLNAGCSPSRTLHLLTHMREAVQRRTLGFMAHVYRISYISGYWSPAPVHHVFQSGRGAAAACSGAHYFRLYVMAFPVFRSSTFRTGSGRNTRCSFQLLRRRSLLY